MEITQKKIKAICLKMFPAVLFTIITKVIMVKVQVANSRQMRHDPQLRGAPMGKRDE